MYRVVIVDDEAWNLVGLRKLLETAPQRFRIVFETTDPVEALEAICREQPDAVFADVRMPEISGIDLIRRVKERGVSTCFVVISGFSDFSYVQQALQEGAVDYQLKPMDREKAALMLARLYARLENKNRNEDLMLYAALQDGDRAAQALRRRMTGPLYPCFQVITALLEESRQDMEQWEFGEGTQSVRMTAGPNKYIYIVNSREDKSAFLCRFLNRKLEGRGKAGISGCSDQAGKLGTLLKNSELACYDSFVEPSGRVCMYRPASPVRVAALWRELSEAMQNGRTGQLKKTILGIPDYFCEYGLTAEDAVTLWNLIAGDLPESAGADFDSLDLGGMIEKFTDLKAMCEELYEKLCGSGAAQPGTVNGQFMNMLAYIDRHYADDLYLKELCELFFINMSYCCELFRRTKNMTFSQYVTEIRIGKACGLLRDPGLSIREICEQVGYKDYFYFNKVFKKNMGCTPFEYRKDQNGGE